MTRRIVLMMVALLCMALAMGSLGCGNSSGSGSPEQVVKDFWSALQKGDIEKARTYLSEDIADEAFGGAGGTDSSFMTKDMIVSMMGAYSLKVIDSEINGDEAVVNIEMTMPDFESIMEELFSSLDINSMDPTDEGAMTDFAEEYIKLIKSAPTVTEEGPLPLVKEGGAWKIEEAPFDNFGGL